jgi:DNA adenine methylase
MIKSPLRYPGGKSKAIDQISPLIPDHFEFREPFVGGGSVFLYCKQSFHSEKFWINDLNFDLYLFWKYASEANQELVNAITQVKNDFPDGRVLFEKYKGNWESFSDFDRAVRFFVLNRITFSGTIDSGGYSEMAFRKRFTDSSIKRIIFLAGLLKNIHITNLDYEPVVTAPGDNVFIFLDPPYFSTTKSRLYGKNGDLHAGFDHERFASVMSNCKHKWLITYDDCEEIRKLFKKAFVMPWNLQYGMNNYLQDTARKGNEIFISNYPLYDLTKG